MPPLQVTTRCFLYDVMHLFEIYVIAHDIIAIRVYRDRNDVENGSVHGLIHISSFGRRLTTVTTSTEENKEK